MMSQMINVDIIVYQWQNRILMTIAAPVGTVKSSRSSIKWINLITLAIHLIN